MRSYVLFCLFVVLYLFISPSLLYAIYDPTSVPNNKIGIHILQPDELESASKLVNNNNSGDWGYVTVPIQSTDRDRLKWLRFMQRARELHVIPIVRIATFADGPNWAEPNNYDLTDFANFLNDLPWPIENRYIIVFNEVNRTDEFGGAISPERYADILNNAIDIFKSRSDKFFILPAGLDNAAANSPTSTKWSAYLERMYRHNSDIFNRIDGWTSHAYPNPEFAAYPRETGPNKIDSFKSDLRLLRRFTAKSLPIFITETGWSNLYLARERLAEFYRSAFSSVWADPRIIAITPFLLQAGVPPFEQFSFMDKNNQPTLSYLAIQKLATVGTPLIDPNQVTDSSATIDKAASVTPASITPPASVPVLSLDFLSRIVNYFSEFFISPPFNKVLTVGNKTYFIETVESINDLRIGLAKYDSLPANRGMLFKFSQTENHTFWMKDMKFDIDIVWILDNKVVGVSQGYFRDPEKTISIPSNTDSVLEVNPNSNIKVGDTVNIK